MLFGRQAIRIINPKTIPQNKMSRFPYQFFDQYIFRSPLFTLQDFLEKADRDRISENELKTIFSDPVYMEAVYLASPYLHDEIEAWKSGKKLSSGKQEKLIQTLLKYHNRISTRCTPFGLFAGVGLGHFTDQEKNNYDRSCIRDTKLDMQFLVGLSQDLVHIPYIKNRILFFPNNSIYRVGRRIRYVEYEYSEGKRQYIISSALRSKELDDVLETAITGKTIDQIIQILVTDEITYEEAAEFIDELIESQILVSELEPNVSGDDFFNSMIRVLKRIGAEGEAGTMISIRQKLEELDQNIGNSVELYKEIEMLIKTFDTDYLQKHLFQTDMYFQNEHTLPKYWKKELKKGIAFLNKITPFNTQSVFERFKKAFSEKFESEEVSLSYAMDTEIGIGYRQNNPGKGLHPYLEDLDIPQPATQQNIDIHLNPVQLILNKKVQDSLLKGENIIQLSDEDFKDFNEDWENLPETFSVMAELVASGNQEKLYLYGGGSSAANLSARFCSEKSEVKDFTKSVTDKEKELDPNVLLAEIVHLPEARIGNVIRRPLLRDYEIPYLAFSSLPVENQITVDDLYISFRGNKIVLRSKKLDREVKPYLTNAHNYSLDSLPVYHFLSDLSSQGKRPGVGFHWGDLKKMYSFLPRVEYKNIILSKAQWEIRKEDTEILLQYMDNNNRFLSAMKDWCEIKKIPQWVQWAYGDNTLVLNLGNYDLAKLLVDTVQVKESIVIEEFLYNRDEDFMHQFVFSLYKDQ